MVALWSFFTLSERMTNRNEPKANKHVAEKAIRHINFYGGRYEDWYVGIEDFGSDRDDSGYFYPARYDLKSDDEAKLTMSWLLGVGLQADDEYGVEPTILFIYTKKQIEENE
ncbi:hypothetical protein [Pseudodesulfovibrio sp.]|uniref:hypothetical protein n=1 Tax=unclassified Pseudodesulfovibrio TaxID=2661612 RepID=UPI003AFFFFC2